VLHQYLFVVYLFIYLFIFRPSSFFFSFIVECVLKDLGSVGRKKKKKPAKIKLELGGPLPQQITRCGYTVAANEGGKIDFVVRIKREHGKN